MRRGLAALGLVLATCGCSNLRVSHDYDLDADFSGYASYAWLEPEEVGREELTYRRAVDQVDATLGALGFESVGRDAADFWVAVHVDTEQRVRVTDWGLGYDWRLSARYGSSFGGAYGARVGTLGGVGAARLDVVEYDEGVLFVDVVDAVGGHLVWRGVARRPIDEGATPTERDARVREAVERLLEPFPPGH